jgi:hypothetical protein
MSRQGSDDHGFGTETIDIPTNCELLNHRNGLNNVAKQLLNRRPKRQGWTRAERFRAHQDEGAFYLLNPP